MARTTYVKKARESKRARHCEVCGKDIGVGDAYKWVAPRAHRAAHGHKRFRCATCPAWRQSELTSSAIKNAVYAAQEAFEDAIGEATDVDSVKELLEAVAEGYREAAEAARESAQNMEDGFGHPTSLSDELNERADSIEAAADELDYFDPSDDADEDAFREGAEFEVQDDMLSEYEGEESLTWDDFQERDEYDAEEYANRVEDLVAEKVAEAMESVRDEARDAVYATIEE